MKITKLILAFAAVFGLGAGMSAFAQSKVTGTVTDSETGEPLIGVSIGIEGTTRGVITDLDGNYSIEASAGQTLVFGYLGYTTVKQEVPAKAGVLNVEMTSDINTLDAVVLLGYSSVKKAELSSSVVSVQGEKLRDVTTSDIGTMLQGKVAGVSVFNSSGAPGAAATIRIRGTGSLSADSSPLYVVDGVVGGTFSPNDVETITVLKDAGTTAIYGASGAGGVIVVTTKSAKKGQDATVDFKANVGVKQVLTGRFSPMDAYEFADYLKAINPNFYVPKDLESHNFDWVEEATRLGVTQNYYASAAGSSDKMTYLASIDYFDELGTAKATDYSKLSARVNVGAQIAKNLTMNVKVNYETSKSHNQSVLGSAYNELPFDSPIDARTGDYVLITGAKRPDSSDRWLGHDKNNPFWSQKVNQSGSNGTFLVADFQLIWNITDHLSLSSTNRYGDSNSHSRDVTSPEAKSGTYPDGYVYESTSWGTSFGTTNILKYSQTFASDHSVSAMLGQEWGASKSKWMSAAGTGITNGLTALSTLTNAEKIQGSETEAESWSLFGQAMYSFKEKYIFNATFRADASSVFAPNNRVGYFPSVSGAWVASSEDFMKGQDLISFLKVRASYGTTGNSGLEPYSYLDVYSFDSKFQYEGVAGGVPSSVANPDLHWETAVMANVGFDISLKNFLTVNLDLYNNENRDLLLSVPLSPNSGFDSRVENTGTIRNRGVELEINSTNVNKRNFKWNTSFNIGFNKNTVVYLPNHEDIIIGSAIVRQIYREGEDLFTWYMPKWIGVDPETGDPLWEHIVRDEEGNPTGEVEPTSSLRLDEDAQMVGTAQPKFTGGLANTFSFYGFDLSVNMQYTYGNKIFNWTRRVMDSDGAYNDYNAVSLNNGLGWSRWEQPGDIATHPKPMTGGNKNANESTSRYLEDGSYLRIKNVTLSYTIPSKILKKVNLQDAKVFLSGDNLYTFTKFSGMDPEVNMAGTISSTYPAGTYSYNYPVGRLFSLGVSVRF